MAGMSQNVAENENYVVLSEKTDPQALFFQMILEMLMNQQVQKESVTGVQEDKQVVEQDEQQAKNKKETAIIQSSSNELLQMEKERALEQRIHLLYTLFS